MFDFSFFALLFLIAQALSPPQSQLLTLRNSRHREQAMEWRRGGDGRWAMTLNGRDFGQFERAGDDILHHTGSGEPTRIPIAELVVVGDLPPGPTTPRGRVRIGPRLRGIVDYASSGGAITLSDPSRELLRVPLHLTSR